MIAPPSSVPVVDVDMLSQEYLHDPQAVMQPVQKKTPVFFLPQMQSYVVTRFDDVSRVLKDVETFSSVTAQIPPLSPRAKKLVSGEDERIVRELFANQIVFTDPPTHTAERRSAQQTFTRKRVATTLPRIEQICDELIDQFESRGEAELMDEFARRFSLRVVGDMLGLDIDDLERFDEMILHFFSLLVPATADIEVTGASDEVVASHFASIIDGHRYFSEILEDRLRSPRDDMATAMLTLRDPNGELVMSHEDVLAHMIGIVAAGTDTTSNLIGSLVLRLSELTELRDAAIADPSLWPAIVEEGLRRESPADKVFRRVTCDTEIRGIEIPQGAQLMVLFSSANGDPDQFPDPLKFDIERPEIVQSIHFGQGRHFCLGAPIVRPEGHIALERLYSRLSGLSTDISAPTKFAPILMRIRNDLNVTWDPTSLN